MRLTRVIAVLAVAFLAACSDLDDLSPDSDFVSWKFQPDGVAFMGGMYPISGGNIIFRRIVEGGNTNYNFAILDDTGKKLLAKTILKQESGDLFPIGLGKEAKIFYFLRESSKTSTRKKKEITP